MEETPLTAASLEGHIGIMRLLLENGTDVNGVKKGALQAAYLEGFSDIVQVLLETDADSPATPSAQGHLEMLTAFESLFESEPQFSSKILYCDDARRDTQPRVEKNADGANQGEFGSGESNSGLPASRIDFA
ncbi:hypothetical protein B0H19DRAFT_1062978 [Mycena capillaripes]|nr:hypothetical protein B0H19DRAFT_1062978 [Mycena capillaripes]